MILAFDTSNYTTSICIVDKGIVIKEWRTLVKVKSGDQGIRQSDAFYQHTQVLQKWVESELVNYAHALTAVCVSTKPRPVEGSYMPVFNAGMLIGQTIAFSKGIRFIETTHQEGHLYAALKTAAGLTIDREPLLFFHLSGGTTELHLVRWSKSGVHMPPLFETADISVGQLVDRIGVASGLDFPSGAQMDLLAKVGAIDARLPKFKVTEKFNLSGYENFFKQLLKNYPQNPEWVYDVLFKGIFQWLSKIIEEAASITGVNRVLLAGGVAASENLSKQFVRWQDEKRIMCYISNPKYASDNAYGVALIGEETIGRI